MLRPKKLTLRKKLMCNRVGNSIAYGIIKNANDY